MHDCGGAGRVAMRRVALFLLMAAVAASANAQDASKPPPTVKQEIIVTAAREEQPRDQAAAAVTVLTMADIRKLPAESLADLLAYVPGVTMMFDSSASGVPMITSRGFFGGGEVEYVKLIVDGVPVGDAESGNVDWRSFRTSDIERLEVLHGPGSSLYGDTALGGVVQVFTRQQTSGNASGELHLSGGSFDTRNAELSYLGAVDAIPMDIYATTSETDGFRAHAANDNRGARLALLRFGEHSRWRFEAAGDRKDRREPGPLSFTEIGEDRKQSNPLFRFDREQTDRYRVAAAYDSFTTTPLHVTAYGLGRASDNLGTHLLAPRFGTSSLRSLTTRAGGATFEVSSEVARGTVRAGADVERAALSGRYSAVGSDGAILGVSATEDGNRDRVGLFVTGGWNPCSRCRLTAGLRRDDLRDAFATSSHHGAWSPRAGLNVRVGPDIAPLSLFLQVSKAFKAPTLDQLFDPRPYPDGSGGTFSVSNPALRPQRARNIEAGASQESGRSDWSIVAYRMTVTDEIDFDPQTFTYHNIGSSLHRGVEARLALARQARVSPEFTYAWTRVADTATPNVQLKNIPEHVTQLLLHSQITGATRADLIYRWTHGMNLDDGGRFAEPAITRLDLRLSHDLHKLRLQLDLLNALDAHYNELGYVLLDFKGRPTAYGFPAPGRTLRGGVTWAF
jgi:outer membrane cobalamin receptor